ncbi:MAG: alpha/beta hydrolase [Lachnospiraceae bacterium]|jgi:alpha-beta hydrolase superfamily lysophospholipase|nr:alpha/beta hydrolase [Lachnospiraceae bacterium]
MRNEFTFKSKDGVTDIHAVEWVPVGRPAGILQIVHGMVEYILRYDEFASFLSEKGFYVVGHDHIGHGSSIVDESCLGYFCEKDANKVLLDDIHALRKLTEKKYPGIRYFILGHSMGSYLLRQYLAIHGNALSGAIIMGTGTQPAALLAFGKTLTKILWKIRGSKYRSPLIEYLGSGSLNAKFKKNGETPKDWITTDEGKKALYLKDPLCGFKFTVNGYHTLFSAIAGACNAVTIRKTPQRIPLLIISGAEDPVGGFGKGVEQAFNQYATLRGGRVDIKLYPDDRHEVLNEKNRTEVYEDIYTFFIDVV